MLVSRIRASAAEGALESTSSGYRLSDTDLWVAERTASDGAEAALALWAGDPGADLDAELMEALGVRADRARARLLSLRAASLLDEGRHRGGGAAARRAGCRCSRSTAARWRC